jgi:hypothetical protein
MDDQETITALRAVIHELVYKSGSSWWCRYHTEMDISDVITPEIEELLGDEPGDG